MQFAKLKKTIKKSHSSSFLNLKLQKTPQKTHIGYINAFLDDQMKDLKKINVFPLYTKLHIYKYLNHLEACKIFPSILAILPIELFELMHKILIQAFDSQIQIPFA
jgi:hypothetical protein